MPLTFVLLGVAALAVWVAAAGQGSLRNWAWQTPLLLSAGAAVYEGFMDWRGSLLAFALFAAVALHARASVRVARRGWAAVALVLAAALATHRLPGFEPWVVADSVRLSPASASFTFNAQFDKAFAGVLLLAGFCRCASSIGEWRRALSIGLLMGLATATVVVGLAAAVGAVRFDPKLPAIAPLWLAANLVLTCIFEEAFFRGVIQDSLAQWSGPSRQWAWLPLLAASALFGLAHAAGGALLVAVATIAGVGYGLAYALSGRVEAAIATHFTLNAIHFIGFTYPYAVR